MATLKPKQLGEWWEIGAKITDPVTKAPIDVTGKAIEQVVRSGPKATDQLATVDDAATGYVSAAQGEVWAGGRISSAPGRYWVTVSVGTASDGRGWPVKDVVELFITDCP